MKHRYFLSLLAALFIGQTATAQQVFSPKMNLVKSAYQTRRAAAPDAPQQRITVVVTCSQEASPATIANQMIEKGAIIRTLMGNQLIIDLPMETLDTLAAMDGVLLIDQPSPGTPRTDTARKASHVDEVHAGKMEGMQDLPQAYTGKGVIIGLIDVGFDYTHPMFKDKDGNLRIKGVYQPGAVDEAHTIKSEQLKDISVTDEKGVTTQINLSGSFYTKPEVILDTALVKDLHGTHGTQCAAIAAGRQVDYTETFWPKYDNSGKLGGMAPEADIFLAERVTTPEQEALSPKTLDVEKYNCLQALSALKHFAAKQGKPLVLSWSENEHQGFHDGTSTPARYISNYCKAGNIMALCASNEGGTRNYVSRKINKGKSVQIMSYQTHIEPKTFVYTRTDKRMQYDLALASSTDASVVYRCYLNATTAPETGEKFILQIQIGKDFVKCNIPAYQQVAENLAKYLEPCTVIFAAAPGNGLDQNDQPFTYSEAVLYVGGLQFKDGYKDLVPMITVTSPDSDVEMQAWGDYAELLANTMEEQGYYQVGDSEHSMGDWCTSGEPVVIGAYASDVNRIYPDPETGQKMLDPWDKLSVGDYAPFSSYGYDFSSQHRSYPDVCAPGVNIYTASNSRVLQDGLIFTPYQGQFPAQTTDVMYPYVCSSGTSMSTPAAAGIIALWVQAALDKGKTLTNADIKDIIRNTSDNDAFTQADPLRFGAGKINAYKGLLYVLGLPTAIPELPAQHIAARLEGRTLHISVNPDTQVVIYDLSGQKLLDVQASQGIVQLPNLPNGVYAVKIGTQGSTLIRL